MSEVAEIQAAIIALKADVGSDAYVSFSIQSESITASLYPAGITGRSDVRFWADKGSPLEIVEALRKQWNKYKATHEAEKIRSLALEIINITADRGECRDVDLRAGKFSQADIDKYGERACAEANDIAGRGPFAIASSSFANAA